MTHDITRPRRQDIITRLHAAGRLVDEPGWEPVATTVIDGAVRRLERLTADDLDARFHDITSRLGNAETLLDERRFTIGAAVPVIDDERMWGGGR